MAEYDDDEQRNAFERAAGFDASTYVEFANIVQHYDDTARPDHDDIDFDSNLDLDGSEYDNNGRRVLLYGIILNFLADFDESTNVDYFNDDYDDDEFYDDDFDDYNHIPSKFSFITAFKFPSYNPFRSVCKRSRASYRYGTWFQYPPSF
jgi:hypothetical protein